MTRFEPVGRPAIEVFVDGPTTSGTWSAVHTPLRREPAASQAHSEVVITEEGLPSLRIWLSVPIGRASEVPLAGWQPARIEEGMLVDELLEGPHQVLDQ